MGRKHAKQTKDLKRRVDQLEREFRSLRSLVLLSDFSDEELDRASGG